MQPMLSDLKLSQKGLLLVAAPLCIQVVLLIALAVLLRETESQMSRIDHNKNVIALANSEMKQIYDASNALVLYTVTRNPQLAKRYDLLSVKVIDGLSELMKEVEDYPSLTPVAARVGALINEVLAVMDGVKEKVETGSVVGPIPIIGDELRHLMKVTNDLIAEMQDFSDQVKEIEKTTPQKARRLRELVELCLGAGVLVGISFIVLAAVFYRRMTGRLGLLMENTIRLKNRESLNPPITGADEIARLDSVFHDTADALNQAIALIQASETRIRTLIENMIVGLVTISPEGSIESVNPRVEEMFGYGPDELNGRPFLYLLEEAENDGFEEFFTDMEQKGLGRISELKARSKSGEIFHIELSLSEFNTQEGPRLMANILDVTERHEVEKLKQQFVAMVSHELRTPLTSIQGFLTGLVDEVYGKMPEQIMNRASMANSSCLRLIALINDLLEIEKMEAGKMEMTMVRVPVATVIARALDTVHNLAEKKGVKLEPESSQAMVMADPDRLVQVMVNLLSNAVKFSPTGSSVRITASADEDFVTLRVIDEGPGISDRYKQLIFERFQQVSESDAKDKGGTGLGLAICKAIVEQLGGRIGVDSIEGKGSTFWFQIPIMPDDVR